MSISSSIDILLWNNKNYKLSILDLIDSMLNNNWKIIKSEKICYLPLEDDDLFEWTESVLTENQLKEIVKQKEIKKEIIGIIFYWKNTDIGISMLMFQDNQITFSLDINRVVIDSVEQMNLTDVNWYIKRIIPCLNTEKFKIQNIKFSQEW